MNINHWNYRVVRHVEDGDEWFTIREVFYHQDGSIEAISAEAIEPAGESHLELRHDLDLMMMALSDPVLDLPLEGGAGTTRAVGANPS